MSLAEAGDVRSALRRLATMLVLSGHKDVRYEKTAADAFTAEDLGLRS